MVVSIRERFLDGRGVGTVGTRTNPLPLEVDLSLGEQSQRLPMRFGFDALPASQFIGFSLETWGEMKLIRHSKDPYAVHVAAAATGPGQDPISFPLITTHNGITDWFRLQPGAWRICVALGMPLEVEVDIELFFRPAETMAAVVLTPGQNERAPEFWWQFPTQTT
jgi:hypothetical protein